MFDLSRFNYMNNLTKKGFNSSLAVFRVLQELRYCDSIVNSTCYGILQCWSEIIETNAKNGVVFDATSNEQPI